jgi:imidazolonepropionase
MWDTIWLEAHLATMARGGTPYGAIRDGAVAALEGRIVWVGARADLPGPPESLARDIVRCGGAWMTPGLVDCHTHLVFAGNRAREFALRLEGASYEEIARAGGGIASTVKATRTASLEQLVAQSAPRLAQLAAGGVTTVEIKSGYGLDLESERRMLKAAAQLAREAGMRVQRTFLGLHALPPEYAENRAGYVRRVIDMIPDIAADADAVDAFCENIAFTPQETESVFAAARAHGLPLKLHAEQLSDQGGAALAARFGALSADHLEWLGDDGIAAMAQAGTVAVLLPGAFYALRETKLPPIDKLRAAGVPLAVATDCNPGTSPLANPLLAMNMACTLFRLTAEEALAGMTREGARALGLQDEIGTLAVGKAADLAVWRIEDPAELAYWIGADLLQARVFAGASVL